VAALYDGEIRFADDALRRLLDGLAVRGQGARTLVVVTADHGEELRDRGGWHHGHTLYDELIRVPLVFAGPGVPAGRRIAAPVQLVDVAPTLLEIARAPRPRGFEGESLWGLIRGAEGAPGAERESFSMMTQSPQRIALVRGRWKAILGPDDALELYDLASDPGERSDLAAREPERAASFRARIGEWRQSRTRGSAPPSLPLERDDEAELRALGYVE
jgi:arylsulfatase A-like enzyme